jgi:KaiC/GvpD/RAD55 family RecA-like ATPase
MLANKKVLYVSAELSNYEIMKRFDSAMSGIAKREVRMRAAEVREKLMSSERYKRALANLVSIEVPMGSTTVKDLEIVIKELHKEDFVPDFLVVDYADNLAPLKYIPNATRLEIYSIYRDLRALGQTFDLAAFTASQTNDMGTAAAEDEKQHMSVRHSNEARAKTHIADLIIGLARTVAERQNNEARAVLLKNRFGGNEGAVVKIFPDFDRSLMWTASAVPLNYASQEEARAANYGAPDSEEGAEQAALLDRIAAGIEDAEQNPPEA